MSELAEKVARSIERVKAFNPEEFGFSVRGGDNKRYHLAFSGGKDSVVTKRILDMAGVDYDAVYRVTSVDPPELVQFIKDKYPTVRFDIPREKEWDDEKMRYVEKGRPITMWTLIPDKHIPPTRRIRYCCEVLKESAGEGGMTVTGVRWAESSNRAKNQGYVTLYSEKNPPTEDFQETPRGGVVLMNDNAASRQVLDVCALARKAVLNPVIDWTDADVWEFIKTENVPCCGLYDEGFHRLGCIGCPMARRHGREREFARWPKYKDLYLLAFERMIEARKDRGLPCKEWQDAQDVYNWWMEYDELPGQIDLFEKEYEDGKP